MPLTLNGSGTVTGISAGGLPDGCIQSADIASGVIPAGGKILTSGVTGSFSGSTASSSFVTAQSFNVTPSASNSKVLIFGGVQHVQDSTTSWHLAVFRDSTNVFERSQWKFSSTNRNFGILDINLLDSPSTTSQITYYIKVKKGGTSGADGFNYGGHYLWFEVAG